MHRKKIKGRFIMLMQNAKCLNEALTCCSQMALHFQEELIGYELSTRRIGIRIYNNVFQRIKYCPWCASPKQESLVEELDKIIFDQLKLDSFDDKRLPREFQTDEWWKKRGL